MLADDCADKDVRLYETIKHSPEAIDKLIRKLVSTSSEMPVVYEAGPCGFRLCRHLTGNGFRWTVAASSMVPKKSGVAVLKLKHIR